MPIGALHPLRSVQPDETDAVQAAPSTDQFEPHWLDKPRNYPYEEGVSFVLTKQGKFLGQVCMAYGSVMIVPFNGGPIVASKGRAAAFEGLKLTQNGRSFSLVPEQGVSGKDGFKALERLPMTERERANCFKVLEELGVVDMVEIGETKTNATIVAPAIQEVPHLYTAEVPLVTNIEELGDEGVVIEDTQGRRLFGMRFEPSTRELVYEKEDRTEGRESLQKGFGRPVKVGGKLVAMVSISPEGELKVAPYGDNAVFVGRKETVTEERLGMPMVADKFDSKTTALPLRGQGYVYPVKRQEIEGRLLRLFPDLDQGIPPIALQISPDGLVYAVDTRGNKGNVPTRIFPNAVALNYPDVAFVALVDIGGDLTLHVVCQHAGPLPMRISDTQEGRGAMTTTLEKSSSVAQQARALAEERRQSATERVRARGIEAPRSRPSVAPVAPEAQAASFWTRGRIALAVASLGLAAASTQVKGCAPDQPADHSVDVAALPDGER